MLPARTMHLNGLCFLTSARRTAFGLDTPLLPSAPSITGGAGTLHSSLHAAALSALPNSLADPRRDARRSEASLSAAASDSLAHLAMSRSYGSAKERKRLGRSVFMRDSVCEELRDTWIFSPIGSHITSKQLACFMYNCKSTDFFCHRYPSQTFRLRNTERHIARKLRVIRVQGTRVLTRLKHLILMLMMKASTTFKKSLLVRPLQQTKKNNLGTDSSIEASVTSVLPRATLVDIGTWFSPP